MLINFIKIILKNLIIINLTCCINFPTLAFQQPNKDCYYQALIIDQQLVHTVTINPTKYKIINASASRINKNVAYVAQIAHKFQALIGINGGFFRAITQDHYIPAGVLKIEHVWQGIAYQPRACLGWDKHGHITLIDRIKTITSILLDKHKFPIEYFNPDLKNHSRNKNNKHAIHITVFSNIYPDFSSLSLLTQNFKIFENDQLNYIYNINYNVHNIAAFSIEALETAKLAIEVLPQLEPEQQATWEKVNFITNGAPVLLKNYQVLSDYASEKLADQFIYTPKARTAIGVLANGFWKIVVTQNITIPQLTTIMQDLKCKDAINLDGGSSSDLYLSTELGHKQGSTALVHPVTDVILVLPI